MTEVLPHLPSLGISGLLFVMWWSERRERTQAAEDVRQALREAARLANGNGQLLDVLRSNTEALTALREELRTHRMSEQEWVTRLSQQLDRLELD